jgi:hypothetical protein
MPKQHGDPRSANDVSSLVAFRAASLAIFTVPPYFKPLYCLLALDDGINCEAQRCTHACSWRWHPSGHLDRHSTGGAGKSLVVDDHAMASAISL